MDDVQLAGGKFALAYTFAGHLQAVFEKRDEPVYENDVSERGIFEFNVPIPGRDHDNGGAD